MTIPNIQFTAQGIDAPTREAVTNGLWALMRQAFGPNITEDSRTPQGQLVTSLTAVITDRDSQFIELANNFDPRYSFGKFQDALGAIYFLSRSQATRSVVTLAFTGLAGSIVPVGAKVQDGNGNIWETTQMGTVDVPTGTVTVSARAQVPGPIQAATGTINNLLDTLPGIDRAENLVPAVPGSNEESRSDFELRRADSVAANSRLTNSAVFGAVFDLPDVIDVRVIDNPSDAAITVGATNYPMIRNSLLVSVVGGDDYEIAGKIMVKGGTGCAFMGNTEVLWKDTNNYDDGFPPEYVVKFLRPTIVPLYFDIRVADFNSVSGPQITAARQSIANQLASGPRRARIGGTVVASSFGRGLDSALGVVEIKVSTDGATWASLIEFGIDQFTSTAANLITVSQYVAAP
jgi:hypothetical protein